MTQTKRAKSSGNLSFLRGLLLCVWMIFSLDALSQSYGSLRADSLMKTCEKGDVSAQLKLEYYLTVADEISVYDAALSVELAEKAIHLAGKLNNTSELSRAELQKSVSLLQDKKTEMALSWLEMARERISKEKQPLLKVYLKIAYGKYYQTTGNNQLAAESYDDAVKLAQTLKDQKILAFAHYHRGTYHSKGKRYKEARADLNIILRENSDPNLKILSLIAIALTYELEYNYSESLLINQKAMKLAMNSGYYGHCIQTHLSSGWNLNDLFKFNDALATLDSGIELSYRYRFYPILAQLFSIKAESYQQLNQLNKSIEFDRMAIKTEMSKKRGMNEMRIGECYMSLGNSYRKLGQFDDALKMTDSSISIYSKLNEYERLSSAVSQKSIIYYKIGNFIQSKIQALRSVELFGKIEGISINMARTYLQIAGIYRYTGDPDSAEYYTKIALSIAEKIDDPETERYICNLLYLIKLDKGDIEGERYYLNKYYQLSLSHNNMKGVQQSHLMLGGHFKRNGEYIKALFHFDSSLHYAKKIGNKVELSGVLALKSGIYRDIGDYQNAVNILFEAIQIIENHPGVVRHNYTYDLANLYAHLGDYEKAVFTINQAIEGFDKTGDINYKLDALLVKSNFLTELNKLDEAEKLASEVLKKYEEKKMNRDVAMSYFQLATIAFKRKNIIKSRSLLDSVFYKLASDRAYIGLTDALVLNAKINAEEHKYQESLNSLDSAIARSKKEGRVNTQLEAIKLKSEIHEKNLQFDRAYESYIQYIQLRDSIHNIDTRNAITRKELQFEYDKKESVFLLNEKLANERIRNSEQELELSKKQILLTQTQLALKNKDLDLQKLAYLRAQAELNNQKISAEKQKIENQIKEARINLFAKQNELQKNLLSARKTERNALMAGIVLIGLLLFFVSLNYYNQRISNRTIQKKNTELKNTLDHLEKTQEQLIASEKQKNLEIEKSRIARDMHDEIGAGLTKISLLSEVLKTEEGNRAEVEAISKTAGELVDNMSQIIWAMNPATNKLENLFGYLRKYSMDFFENTPIKCSINVPETTSDIPLNQFVKRNLFLVIKESLNNIVKHADATEVEIDATMNEEILNIKICDNGKGFDVTKAKNMGNGLNNLSRRMEEIGGSFEINSKQGSGTISVLKYQIGLPDSLQI